MTTLHDINSLKIVSDLEGQGLPKDSIAHQDPGSQVHPNSDLLRSNLSGVTYGELQNEARIVVKETSSQISNLRTLVNKVRNQVTTSQPDGETLIVYNEDRPYNTLVEGFDVSKHDRIGFTMTHMNVSGEVVFGADVVIDMNNALGEHPTIYIFTGDPDSPDAAGARFNALEFFNGDEVGQGSATIIGQGGFLEGHNMFEIAVDMNALLEGINSALINRVYLESAPVMPGG